MFSCLVAGRWIYTNCQQIDQFQFLIDLGDVDQFNHIAVFMTGASLLPENYSAQIFLNWPIENNANWINLGAINNNKPSAIFKVTTAQNKNNQLTTEPLHSSLQSNNLKKQLGIAIVETAQVTLPTTTMTNYTSSLTTVQLIKNIINNFVNYASSFSFCPNPQLPSVTFIPTKVVNEWLTKVSGKLDHDANYFTTE